MSYLPQGQAEEALGIYQDLGVLDPRALNGWMDSVKSFGKRVVTGAVNVYGEQQKAKGAAEAYKAQLESQATRAAQKGMPKWVIPAAVGGGALLLVLLLKKR